MFILSLVLNVLLSGLFSHSAQAASIYDDAVQIGSPLMSPNSALCDPVDVSGDVYSMLSNNSLYARPYHAAMLESFEEALENGAWAIYKDAASMYVSWVEDSANSQGTFFGTTGGVDYVDIATVGTGYKLNTAVLGHKHYAYGTSCDIGLRWANGNFLGMPGSNVGTNYARISKSDSSVHVFLSTFPVVYPTGYEGEPIPSVYVPPAPTYVAMGDSFSSGEGNPPFEAGTDQGGANENRCHRGSQAYPRLLQNDPNLDLGAMAFVACSGATTSNVINGKYGEDPQVDALSADTEVVTITVGGNDIKFREFALACVFSNCSSTSDEYQESWDIMTDSNRSDYLPDKLEAVFAAMANKLTANNTVVDVYVLGYPKVITQASWTETTSSNPNNCLYMSEASASVAEAIIAKLNSTIEEAVEDYDDPRFVYVDPLASGSPFIGHELCRGDGYFRGLESAGIFGGNDAYVFHPNQDGQDAYRQIMADALN